MKTTQKAIDKIIIEFQSEAAAAGDLFAHALCHRAFGWSAWEFEDQADVQNRALSTDEMRALTYSVAQARKQVAKWLADAKAQRDA